MTGAFIRHAMACSLICCGCATSKDKTAEIEATPLQQCNGDGGYHIVGDIAGERIDLRFSVAGITARQNASFFDLALYSIETIAPAPGLNRNGVRYLGGIHQGPESILHPSDYVTVTMAIEDQEALAEILANGAPAGDLPWQFVTSFQNGPGWFQVALPAGRDGRRVVLGTCHTDFGDSRVNVEMVGEYTQWLAKWTFQLDRIRRVVVEHQLPEEGDTHEEPSPVARWARALCDAPARPGRIIGCGNSTLAWDVYQPDYPGRDAGVSRDDAGVRPSDAGPADADLDATSGFE